MKVCPNCGTQLPDNSMFCNICGKNLNSIPQSMPAQVDAPKSGACTAFAIISLACGMISVALSWLGLAGITFTLPLLIGIVGIVFAIASKGKGRDGKATAGLVLSIIGLILSFLFLMAFIKSFSAREREQKDRQDSIREQIIEPDYDESLSKYQQPTVPSATEEQAEEELICHIGERVTLEDGTTIDALESGSIYDYDEWYKPDEGNKYIYFKVKITNDSQESKFATSVNFNAYTDDDALDTAYLLSGKYDPISANLDPGKSATGYLTYQAPEGTNQIQVVYKYYYEFEEKFVTFEIAV